MAAQAVKEGMADRVATLDQALAKLGAKNGSPKAAMAFAAALFAEDEMGDDNLPVDEQDDDTDPDEDNDECACKCEACRATPPNCNDECSNAVCADRPIERARAARGRDAGCRRCDLEAAARCTPASDGFAELTQPQKVSGEALPSLN